MDETQAMREKITYFGRMLFDRQLTDAAGQHQCARRRARLHHPRFAGRRASGSCARSRCWCATCRATCWKAKASPRANPRPIFACITTFPTALRSSTAIRAMSGILRP